MRKIFFVLALLFGCAELAQAQTPFYAAPQRTGPYSGYFYVGPGTRWYYRQGIVYPGYYQQGMNVGGIRVNPYAGMYQFNALMMMQMQQQLMLRRYYYGY